MHTLSVFTAVSLYSLQPNPKYDLTPFGNALLSLLTAVLTGSIFAGFFNFKFVDNLIAGAMAVLGVAYLSYDTQKIVGGKHHKHKFGQREYILAALSIYQDVIMIFLNLLQLLAENDKRRKENK